MCIIDLVAALGVGVIALLHKHVTACMVTGVLYCMASQYQDMSTNKRFSLKKKNHNSINYLRTTTFWYTRNSCNFRFVHCFWTCNFPCEAPLWIVLLPVTVPYSKECMWLPYSDYYVGGSRGMGGRGHLFSSQFLVVISDTCSQSHQSKNYDLII